MSQHTKEQVAALIRQAEPLVSGARALARTIELPEDEHGCEPHAWHLSEVGEQLDLACRCLGNALDYLDEVKL